jgi:hypothetical protein
MGVELHDESILASSGPAAGLRYIGQLPPPATTTIYNYFLINEIQRGGAAPYKKQATYSSVLSPTTQFTASPLKQLPLGHPQFSSASSTGYLFSSENVSSSPAQQPESHHVPIATIHHHYPFVYK